VLNVDDLLRSGRLEVVPADRAAALVRLARAEQHLDTAAALVGHDNEVAYGSLYDAARKAVTALMLANGFRVPAKPGAHEAVGIYAVNVLTDPSGSVSQFQRLRRRRNKSEYDDIIVGRQDVENDLQHARDLVAAVRALL
jgi:RecA/RadA recombinase